MNSVAEQTEYNQRSKGLYDNHAAKIVFVGCTRKLRQNPQIFACFLVRINSCLTAKVGTFGTPKLILEQRFNVTCNFPVSVSQASLFDLTNAANGPINTGLLHRYR
jgi:hypothetical protein